MTSDEVCHIRFKILATGLVPKFVCAEILRGFGSNLVILQISDTHMNFGVYG
jgi:hypothetical protein